MSNRTTSGTKIHRGKYCTSIRWLHATSMGTSSGGSRNLERGVQPLAHEAHSKIFLVATPTSGTLTHS